jgi:hypothetical protein
LRVILNPAHRVCLCGKTKSDFATKTNTMCPGWSALWGSGQRPENARTRCPENRLVESESKHLKHRRWKIIVGRAARAPCWG